MRFAGQYHDRETGLFYNLNRYYDPAMQRYLTQDLVGLAGGLNAYLYVDADPVNWIDPLGLFKQDSTGFENSSVSNTDENPQTPVAGGGASIENIPPNDATRIQNAANRTRQEITVVGSRAGGTTSPISDWDYIMTGNARQRHSAKSSVPRGIAGGEQNYICGIAESIDEDGMIFFRIATDCLLMVESVFVEKTPTNSKLEFFVPRKNVGIYLA